MTTGLALSNVVNVSVNIAPTAVRTRNFGALLIAGNSAVVDVSERIRVYSSVDGVVADFGTTAPEYLAAVNFFAQSPQPAEVRIGRWARTATAGLLNGALRSAAQQDIAIFTAITSGGFAITIDGVLRTLATINLSAAANLNAVAALIQTALSTWGTCVWNANLARFEIASATTGATSIITAVSATPLSTALGITTAAGATTVDGIAAETPVAAAAIFANASTDWYGLMFADTNVTDAQHIAVAAYIEAASPSRIYGITTQVAAALDSASTTDLPYVLKAALYRRTFIQYSSSSPYAAASLYGRAFTVDFTANNTAITLKFKQEPGVTAESLTQSQAAAVKAKNCNVFVKYTGDSAIVQEGTMASGAFFDEVHGLDWFANALQTDLFNLLYQSPTKIPQTDQGVALLTTQAERTCAAAVNNGLVAPGTWTSTLAFGSLKSGDALPKGYYVYAPRVATQSQADREARKSPTIQIALKLAGAIHSVNAIVNVNR